MAYSSASHEDNATNLCEELQFLTTPTLMTTILRCVQALRVASWPRRPLTRRALPGSEVGVQRLKLEFFLVLRRWF